MSEHDVGDHERVCGGAADVVVVCDGGEAAAAVEFPLIGDAGADGAELEHALFAGAGERILGGFDETDKLEDREFDLIGGDERFTHATDDTAIVSRVGGVHVGERQRRRLRADDLSGGFLQVDKCAGAVELPLIEERRTSRLDG